MTITVANLGFPRIGPRRELKYALEAFWAGKITEAELKEIGSALRAAAWARQKAVGVEVIPSNDFSLYDQVLDTSVMIGAIPDQYRALGPADSLAVYFAMARGTRADRVGDAAQGNDGSDLPALEMTKWFDTNYHYMVPEVTEEQSFSLSSSKPVDEFLEAKALGYRTRPVLLGPVTWLLLAKANRLDFRPLSLLPGLLPVYVEVFSALARAGADWVQMDEPALVLDLDDGAQEAFQQAYAHLATAVPNLKLQLTTYFGALGDNLATVLSLPVAGLHVDVVRAPEQLEDVLARARPDLVLSLGVVDGRNVWKADVQALTARLQSIIQSRSSVLLSPSCSLLHCPIDLVLEKQLDPTIAQWLAFAVQKLEELVLLRGGLANDHHQFAAELAANADAIAGRRASPLLNDPEVRERSGTIRAAEAARDRPYAERTSLQRTRLSLPVLPTTTIGSFPQTAEVRAARAAFGRNELAEAHYEQFLRAETERAIRRQEEIGIDVLVHGEFERNDMVQYFAEQLGGFAFTRNGWVQSYGSRCVRPPIIYGDVSRPKPMTVDWWSYAQSLTERPVKGMLTGPVTILNWSFVRDDQPRSETCRQIALAIREEVLELEAAGAPIIQIDEAALREGLPLRRADQQAYLVWAVEAFRICSSGVRPETQIHTHMCYSEFNDIIADIGAMDADVISIESARSKLELLDAFARYSYPNEIGPGVYDIHSPRIPSAEEMERHIREAVTRLSAERLWVNPDCGLKTRQWEDVEPALRNMVAAARAVRAALAVSE